MGRGIGFTTLTKEAVLKKVSQISIFSSYMNLPENIIQRCIDKKELICSPLRDDIHPTCGFRYDNKGKLKFRDFAGYVWGDCFDIVALIMSAMYKKQYDVSNSNDFRAVLRHISFTFKNIFYGTERDINLINSINASVESIKKMKPIIELVIREWNADDVRYWKQFGIDIHYLNTHFVFAVEQYYINRKVNPNPKYFYKKDNPCYAYICGQDRSNTYSIKLYFPNVSKSSIVCRFITNFNHLEGIYNLDRNDYDFIIITKSSKDRLSIGCNLEKMNLIKKIGVINIPHETYRLRQNEYDWLYGKLNKNGKLYSLMDNDRAGKLEALWLRKNYKIPALLIDKKYNSKDFAELANNTSFNQLTDIVNQILKHLTHENEKL